MEIYIIVAVLAAAVVLNLLIIYFIRKNRKSGGYSKPSVRTRQDLQGDIGENTVAFILGDTIKGEQYVINNLLFETEPGKSCQIDHVYINKHGIWVIETKNFYGTVMGYENARVWTQTSPSGAETKEFYNPIKQNATHIYHLSKYLGVDGIFQNAVVFLSNADISGVKYDGVYSAYELTNIKNKITNVNLSVEEMEYYFNRLLYLKFNSKITEEEHIKNIIKSREDLQNGICPRCGGRLMLRNGKNGQFYGCSNFPKCKFSKDIDDAV